MRRENQLIAIAMAAAVLSAAPSLAAQEPVATAETRGFGVQNPFVVSLENLGGVSRITMEPEGDDAESSTSAGTYFGLVPPFAPIARLGLHYFVAPPLSLGAILHYSDNDVYGETMMAGVRIGAAFPISDGTAIWVRGGIAYVSHDEVLSLLEFTDVRPGGELLFVLQPVEHFGFIVGGMFEMGIAGEMKTRSFLTGDSIERDYDYMEFGLTLGVLADF